MSARSAVAETAGLPAAGAACAVCGGTDAEVVHERAALPVQSSRLARTRAEARAVPSGAMRLSVCLGCGFVANAAFDPSLVRYDDDYEDSQAFSPRFLEYARGLVGDLVERYGLAGAHAVDVGCGSADFLTLWCEASGGTGTGYDPAATPGALHPPADRIRIVRTAFTEATGPVAAGLVSCRHTLEHLARPDELVGAMRAALDGTDAVLVVEVPDVERIFATDAFWDVYYEHAAYFAPSTLVHLLARSGFDVLRSRRVYDDQYLVVEARPAREGRAPTPAPRAAHALVEAARGFGRRVDARVAELRARLDAAASRGERVVLWGAGSKAVGLLSTLHDAPVEHVVDVNPAKWGSFVPGGGQEIVAPERLADLHPDRVWVMNPVYCEEVEAALAGLGLTPGLEAL